MLPISDIMSTILEELGKDDTYLFNTSLVLPIGDEKKAIMIAYILGIKPKTSAEMSETLRRYIDETT